MLAIAGYVVDCVLYGDICIEVTTLNMYDIFQVCIVDAQKKIQTIIELLKNGRGGVACWDDFNDLTGGIST